MATVSNYREEYIKYNSDAEGQPDDMPITHGALPEGTFLYDTATGEAYVRTGGEWLPIA